MCVVVWWLSPQWQAGDAITPHRWRDTAHLAWPNLRRLRVTNLRLGMEKPRLRIGWVSHKIMSGWHPSIHDCSHISCSICYNIYISDHPPTESLKFGYDGEMDPCHIIKEIFTSWEYTVSWYRTPERILLLLVAAPERKEDSSDLLSPGQHTGCQKTESDTSGRSACTRLCTKVPRCNYWSIADVQKMCAIKWSHAATASESWQELTARCHYQQSMICELLYQ